jgi:hypothetical protein
MNNQFINLLADSAILHKQLSHFAGSALSLNRHIQKRFPDSERTGQCASFISGEVASVSSFYVPSNETDKKLRYSKNAHNKLLFLIEHEDRISTAPQNTEEKEKFEKDSVWRGGVRLYDGPLITVSGFHPVVDEAFSLSLGLAIQGFERDSTREKWIKDQAIKFQNPYALALCVLTKYINPQTGYTYDFETSMEWGLKEIGENFL